MTDLSLFDIERGLHELLGAWQEAETPEAMAAAEQAIQAHVAAEVRKVDGIRRYLRACESQAAAAKAEAEVQTGRARMWTARRDRIKAMVYDCMKSFGVTKLEGQTGTLAIRGNGGLQPLYVGALEDLPGNLIDVVVTMPLDAWEKISTIPFVRAIVQTQAKETMQPNNQRIREAIAAEGGVPGARLEQRGDSLIVK